MTFVLIGCVNGTVISGEVVQKHEKFALSHLWMVLSYMPWEDGLRWIGACHTTKTRDAGTFASICSNNDIKTLVSIDYGDTGKCNFYKTDDIFGNSPAAMAFPV